MGPFGFVGHQGEYHSELLLITAPNFGNKLGDIILEILDAANRIMKEAKLVAAETLHFWYAQ